MNYDNCLPITVQDAAAPTGFDDAQALGIVAAEVMPLVVRPA